MDPTYDAQFTRLKAQFQTLAEEMRDIASMRVIDQHRRNSPRPPSVASQRSQPQQPSTVRTNPAYSGPSNDARQMGTPIPASPYPGLSNDARRMDTPMPEYQAPFITQVPPVIPPLANVQTAPRAPFIPRVEHLPFSVRKRVIWSISRVLDTYVFLFSNLIGCAHGTFPSSLIV